MFFYAKSEYIKKMVSTTRGGKMTYDEAAQGPRVSPVIELEGVTNQYGTVGTTYVNLPPNNVAPLSSMRVQIMLHPIFQCFFL